MVRRQAATRPRQGTALNQRAYEHVKRGILTQDYPAGHVIGESEVAELMGVSRTPVREAFLRLQAEGLLELVPRRGAVVPAVAAQELVHLLQARLLVERYALRCVLRDATMLAGTIAAMHAAQREMRSYIEDGERFWACDRDFHSQAVLAGGNEVFADMQERAANAAARSGQIAMLATHAGSALAEHDAILQALDAGDEDTVDLALSQHVASELSRLQGWVLDPSGGAPLGPAAASGRDRSGG